MAGVDVNRGDPLEAWAEPLEAWLRDSAISEERSRRAVLAFGRFSAWVIGQGLGAEDVNEDVIDEYVDLERQRSGSSVPAAAQYLPLVKRFLVVRGVLVLRPPVQNETGMSIRKIVATLRPLQQVALTIAGHEHTAADPLTDTARDILAATNTEWPTH